MKKSVAEDTRDIRKNPNRKEHTLMLDLMVLRHTLASNMDAVNERLSYWPYGKRDMHLLFRLVDKLQAQLLLTMPPQRNQYYQHVAREAEVIVEIPGPVPRGRYITISEKYLTTIVSAAMAGECMMCLREGKEVTRCPIREALLEVAPPAQLADDRPHAGCEYWRIASSVVGEEDAEL